MAAVGQEDEFPQAGHGARQVDVAIFRVHRAAEPSVRTMMVVDRPLVAARHDIDMENGPMMVVPGSHKGPIHDHHGPDGRFCGAMDPENCDIDLSRAVPCLGKAGSITIHHVRAVTRLPRPAKTGSPRGPGGLARVRSRALRPGASDLHFT